MEAKIKYIENVLKDALNYIAEDAECICDETLLESAKEIMDKIDKAIDSVKEIKDTRYVDANKCLVVSPEDFEMRGYLTHDLSEEELNDMATSAAEQLNNNECVMDCFWLTIDEVASEEGLLKYNGEKYALCSIIYKDNPDNSFESYIKLSCGEDINDESIFFYCDSIEDLASLTDDEGVEDFYIDEILEFTNEI